MQILTNKILLACLTAWFLSQAIKTALKITKEKKFDINYLIFGVGGMPSSHTAVVSSLAASILLLEGATTLFALSLIFAIIVMRDSIWMRKAHNLREVFVGAVLGILVAVLAI